MGWARPSSGVKKAPRRLCGGIVRLSGEGDGIHAMTDRARPHSREGAAPPAAPPHRVGLPINVHHWDSIAFLHWPFDPDDIAPLVPGTATVLTHEGVAWVGITPFRIRVRPPGSPIVPPRWAFPETNMRTYVRGPDGREGLWFLHMEVTALWFVLTLRAFGLPYHRRQMSVDRVHRVDGAVDPHGARITYRSQPRGRAAGGHHIVVRPGNRLDPPEGAAQDRVLTARWGAFHRRGPLLLYTPVEHPSWPLHHAEVEVCEVGGLFRAAGLPVPAGRPRAHFSHGVTVNVGVPHVVAAAWRGSLRTVISAG